MSYEKATVLAILTRIHNKELVLPAIQRDFVWGPEKMYKLLDSIFRGFPFSTLLFWNTKMRIQYREFTRDWYEGLHYSFQIKEERKKGTLVLDGQQRLQTLYLAVHGHHEQKTLHFDLLSGCEPDDVSQAKFHFEFLSSLECEHRNRENSGTQYWVPLRDVALIEVRQKLAKADYYATLMGISGNQALRGRLLANIETATDAFREEIINFYTIDKEYGEEGTPVTSLDEILEIFVRVNSGGQVLSKSDLMFSLMQMLWEGAADAISDLIESLNRKGRYDFDKDFILKCALVCCGKGAKYEVSKLRDDDTVHAIQLSFPKIARALENCIEFVISKGRFLDDRILRSYNTLIPFVHFFYLQPEQHVKSEETQLQMNLGLYLSLMTSLFSRFADNYIDQVVNNIIRPNHQTNPGQFPLEEYLAFVHSKQGRSQLDDWLLQNNIHYLMNILEGGTRLPEGRRVRRPEVDHIFPYSKLKERGVPEDRINHYANFRLISQPENNWKRAQDPQPYFKANPKAAARYFIPTHLLGYDQYDKFIEKRREMVWRQLKTFFGQGSLPGANQATNKDSRFEVQPASGYNGNVDAKPPIALRPILDGLLTGEEKDQPVFQDTSQWVEIFKAVPISPQWSGRYHWALHKAGIQNVGDFAAAVVALKLKITHYSYDLPGFKFVSSLPDGAELTIPTREFGGYAWKWALATLEHHNFDWTKHIVS